MRCSIFPVNFIMPVIPIPVWNQLTYRNRISKDILGKGSIVIWYEYEIKSGMSMIIFCKLGMIPKVQFIPNYYYSIKNSYQITVIQFKKKKACDLH